MLSLNIAELLVVQTIQVENTVPRAHKEVHLQNSDDLVWATGHLRQVDKICNPVEVGVTLCAYAGNSCDLNNSDWIPHTELTLSCFLPDVSAPNDQVVLKDQTEHQTNSLKRKAPTQSVIPPSNTEWQNLFDAELATFDSFPKHSAGQYMNV